MFLHSAALCFRLSCAVSVLTLLSLKVRALSYAVFVVLALQFLIYMMYFEIRVFFLMQQS